MIEVFKTNVVATDEAHRMVRLLLQHFPECKISFDLEDHDKVLRIAGNGFCSDDVIALLASQGFICMELV